MRIAIDIRSTTKKKTGIGYYTFNFVNNLASIDKQNQYTLYSKIGYFNRSKQLLDLPGGNFRHCINRLGLSPKFLLRNIDILHSSSYDIKKPKGAKLILVVHDVIHRTYPEGHSKETVRMVEEQLTNILPEADRLIANTNTVKEDFLRFYKFPSEKISVIYAGIDEAFFQDVDKQQSADLLNKHNIEIPFILFIGTLEPRKNITGLIKAFDILKKDKKIPHKLVIVGMRGWMYAQIFETINKLNLAGEVIFTDYLAQTEARCLLRCADVFVYPSFYEGTGFPVLEAFASGAAVVTSNNSSLKEIAKDCALLIDPDEPANISEAIYKIISDAGLKQQLIEKGLKRAREFSWRKTARETLKIFKEMS